MRDAFTYKVELRRTETLPTGAVQHLVQQSANATMRNGASMFIESAEQVATRFGQELSPEMQNPQEKPEDSEERLRPDLNRGWRICNPLP